MASKISITSSLLLPSSSDKIPQIGLGVYRSDASVCEKTVLAGLKAGYRHIDSAQFYANEAQCGTALAQVIKSGRIQSRSNVFLTTKILAGTGSVEKSLDKCRKSVEKMDPEGAAGKGYVDLFLIHSPNAGKAVRKELWLALEGLKKEGRAREIGVSNYGRGHIEEMKEYATVWPPAVNQIEVRTGFAFGVLWRDDKSADGTDSFIRGASRKRPWLTASRKGLSSRRTVPSFG